MYRTGMKLEKMSNINYTYEAIKTYGRMAKS
jgi:hypothetical protein